MSVKNFEELFIHELSDTYSAEKQILEALPKRAAKASDAELRKAFEEHRVVTEEQVTRLQTIFAQATRLEADFWQMGLDRRL